jgi:serine/threonine protein phosphatase PrpC
MDHRREVSAASLPYFLSLLFIRHRYINRELYLARLHHMDLADPLVMDKAQNMNWVTIHRVCGELAVSRSIGDPDYKSFVPGAPVDAFFSWPDGHQRVFLADLVIPDPECQAHDISPEDEFLVLASDGLWDVISSSEVVEYIK